MRNLKNFPQLALVTAISMSLLACQTTNSNTVSAAKKSTKAGINTYKVIDTGQYKCFDGDGEGGKDHNAIVCGAEYQGQDAEFGKNSKAFDFEFLTDADGNILYEEKTYDNNVTVNKPAVVIDNNTALMWEGVPTHARLSYAQAQEYIDSLNDKKFQGFSDWRMPTIKELYSIADFSEGWPYLDMDYFTLPTYEENNFAPVDFEAKDEQYWSQKYVGNTHEAQGYPAWGLNHGTGHIKAYPATVEGFFGKAIRAVRGTEGVYGVNNFALNKSDNGNTVTDKATGLMWTQDDAASGKLLAELQRLIATGKVNLTDGGDAADVGEIGLLNWEDALAFAENADFGGHSDWRLPNIKELQSIFDYDHAPTAGFYHYEDPDAPASEKKGPPPSGAEIGAPGSPPPGAPTMGNETPHIWYDACNPVVVAAKGKEAATTKECAARGPAIDTNYFIATSINDLLKAGLATGVMEKTDKLYELYNTVTVQAGLNDYGYYWSSTSAHFSPNDKADADGYRKTDYAFAWYAAVGTAVNGNGEDFHGAGAVRNDVKDETSGAVGEDAERVFNFIRLVRDAD